MKLREEIHHQNDGGNWNQKHDQYHYKKDKWSLYIISITNKSEGLDMNDDRLIHKHTYWLESNKLKK